MENFRIKPYKKDFTYSYTLGAFPSIELFECHPSSVFHVFLSQAAEGSKGSLKLRELSKKYGVPVAVDDKAIERVSPKDNVHAVCVFNKFSCELDYSKNHVVLVNPSDMGNLGTILRTLIAFGIENVAIISPAADIFDPKAVRASMGALFRINFDYFPGFDEYFKKCAANRRLYPFMLGGSDLQNVSMPRKDEPYSLIFGNESRGLPEEFFNIGQPVEIRHLKTVDSLNLTIALGIGIYHFCKGDMS